MHFSFMKQDSKFYFTRLLVRNSTCITGIWNYWSFYTAMNWSFPSLQPWFWHDLPGVGAIDLLITAVFPICLRRCHRLVRLLFSNSWDLQCSCLVWCSLIFVISCLYNIWSITMGIHWHNLFLNANIGAMILTFCMGLCLCRVLSFIFVRVVHSSVCDVAFTYPKNGLYGNEVCCRSLFKFLIRL